MPPQPSHVLASPYSGMPEINPATGMPITQQPPPYIYHPQRDPNAIYPHPQMHYHGSLSTSNLHPSYSQQYQSQSTYYPPPPSRSSGPPPLQPPRPLSYAGPGPPQLPQQWYPSPLQQQQSNVPSMPQPGFPPAPPHPQQPLPSLTNVRKMRSTEDLSESSRSGGYQHVGQPPPPPSSHILQELPTQGERRTSGSFRSEGKGEGRKEEDEEEAKRARRRKSGKLAISDLLD